MMQGQLLSGRLAHLDGLRGVAILLVVLFHAYSRWPDLVPFGATYADFPLARFGFLGVQLFFLISGFVILMTLETSRSLMEFLARRWLRLFPAMLICSAIVFGTSSLFSERPQGQPLPVDLLPGLLFTEPAILAALLGTPIRPIEGAFWSLFVEVQFYVVFGSLYFIVGQRWALVAMGALFAAAWIKTIACLLDPSLEKPLARLHTGLHLVGAFHYGWFLAGALLYRHSQNRSRTLLLGALAAIVLASLQQAGNGAAAAAWALALGTLVVLPTAVGLGKQLLATPALLFVGAISYPLYLLHENMMISLIVKLHAAVPQVPGILLPVLPVAALMLVTWPIARTGEPLLRKLLTPAWSKPAAAARH